MMKITTARLLGLFAVVALAGLVFSGGAAADDDCGDWCVTPDTQDIDQSVFEDHRCGASYCDPADNLDEPVFEDHRCGASYCDPADDLDRQFFGTHHVQLVS